MRAVVTGGTGFVGTALVRALEGRGDEVVVLSRRAAPAEGSRRALPRTPTVAWTPGQRGPWMAALDGASAVFNLAGAGLFDERWSEARLAEIRSSRIDSTRVLSEAIAERAPSAPLVSASAVGFYGMRKDDAVLDEDSPRGRDVLGDICEAWEAAADPARAAGVRVCHPRLGIVLGRGGGALGRMTLASRALVGGPLGDGKQWLSFVQLDDAVTAILRMADDPSLSGPFNATAPQPVTMNDFAKALGRAMNRPSFFRVPAFALKLTLGEGRAQALLCGQRVVPKRLLASGFSFRYPTIDEALAASV